LSSTTRKWVRNCITRSIAGRTLEQILARKIKENVISSGGRGKNEMGGACSAYGGGERCV